MTAPQGEGVSTAVAWPDSPADVVVIFGHTWWERAVNRGRHRAEDRLITHLLESPRVGRLVVADNYRDWPVYLLKRLRGERTAPLPPRPASRAASRFRPRRLFRHPDTNRRGASRSARRYSHRLGAHARRHGLSQPHVICLNPVFAGFSPFEWAGSVTFFATDDWAAHSQFARQWDVIEQSYALVRSQGRPVGAVTTEIMRRITAGGEGLVIPNGVDPADWSSPGTPPDWVADLPRPLAVYVGAIAEQRLDVDAVGAVAAALGGTVLIVGPVTDRDVVAALRALPGVQVRPPVPYAAVPGLLASADLALLPHHRTPLTASMSPLKVYEALAAGVPVIATDLAPVRGLSDAVVLVAEGDDWGFAALDAMKLREQAAAERLAFARANAWQVRADSLLDAVLRQASSADTAQ